MGRSTEPSMESSLPRLESLEGPLHCCYFLSVRSKHRCSVDKFRAGLYTLLPSSCSRLKLDLLRTWSKGVGMDRWQRWSVGASQTYSSLWNLVRPTGGIGLGAWWGFGDRVGPVSVGVRKRGKPSRARLRGFDLLLGSCVLQERWHHSICPCHLAPVCGHSSCCALLCHLEVPLPKSCGLYSTFMTSLC